MKVTVRAEGRTADEILEMVAAQTGVQFDLRWDGVLFSTPERLWPGPGEASPLAGPSGIDGADLPALDRVLTLDFYDMTPLEMLRKVAEMSQLKLLLLRPNMERVGKIRLYWVKVRVRHIVKYLTRPFGDDIRLEDGTLIVEPSGR